MFVGVLLAVFVDEPVPIELCWLLSADCADVAFVPPTVTDPCACALCPGIATTAVAATMNNANPIAATAKILPVCFISVKI